MHPIGSNRDLSARLLASGTATQALEDWCHEHRIAAIRDLYRGTLVARRAPAYPSQQEATQ